MIINRRLSIIVTLATACWATCGQGFSNGGAVLQSKKNHQALKSSNNDNAQDPYSTRRPGAEGGTTIHGQSLKVFRTGDESSSLPRNPPPRPNVPTANGPSHNENDHQRRSTRSWPYSSPSFAPAPYNNPTGVGAEEQQPLSQQYGMMVNVGFGQAPRPSQNGNGMSPSRGPPQHQNQEPGLQKRQQPHQPQRQQPTNSQQRQQTTSAPLNPKSAASRQFARQQQQQQGAAYPPIRQSQQSRSQQGSQPNAYNNTPMFRSYEEQAAYRRRQGLPSDPCDENSREPIRPLGPEWESDPKPLVGSAPLGVWVKIY